MRLGQFDPFQDHLELGFRVIRRVGAYPVANQDAQVVMPPTNYLSDRDAEAFVDRGGEVRGADFAREMVLHDSARQRAVKCERHESVIGAEPLGADVTDAAADPVFIHVDDVLSDVRPGCGDQATGVLRAGNLTVPIGRDAEPTAVLRDVHPTQLMRRRSNFRILTGSGARREEHEPDQA